VRKDGVKAKTFAGITLQKIVDQIFRVVRNWLARWEVHLALDDGLVRCLDRLWDLKGRAAEEALVQEDTERPSRAPGSPGCHRTSYAYS
jgi:hypothetical protein